MRHRPALSPDTSVNRINEPWTILHGKQKPTALVSPKIQKENTMKEETAPLLKKLDASKNGIIVYCEGRESAIPLTPKQAEWMEYFYRVSDILGETQPEKKPLSRGDEGFKRRDERHNEYLRSASNNVGEFMRRYLEMDDRDRASVIALCDVMEPGDCNHLSGYSWVKAHIKDLLLDVMIDGVVGANEQEPREQLALFAYRLFEHWDGVEDARVLLEHHPALFLNAVGPNLGKHIKAELDGATERAFAKDAERRAKAAKKPAARKRKVA